MFLFKSTRQAARFLSGLFYRIPVAICKEKCGLHADKHTISISGTKKMSLTFGNITAGNDTPISRVEEDRYGFIDLARNLARSIISLDRQFSTVIGIEGKWGSGKTSLLNLLLQEMLSQVPDGTHVLKISPWLSPSGDSTVEGLLLPVAAILDEAEAKRYRGFRKFRHRFSSRASPLATSMLSYAQQASGRLAPLAELVGNWVPGAGIAASTLKTVSAAQLSARRQTTAELRTEIEKKMSELQLNFIVVLDDLDRLEPDQAVEVLRLIRSVADFSGFHYVMCYDPEVLGQAVERGLGVTDGRQYLQKIIPLSFNLPLPESFDLRHEFLAGATALYETVNNVAIDYTLAVDLKSVTGTFGATLRTPREVRMALGNLVFRYESLREHIWFPDLCLLQLLRVALPGLYSWTEQYLTEYAVVASGTGHVSDKEKAALKGELKELLSALPAGSPLTVMELSRWLPGIGGINEESLVLFTRVSEQNAVMNETGKRLASSAHWRFYFSFTPPTDVLPLEFFADLFRLAGQNDDKKALDTLLLNQIVDSGFSSRTWFEHIIDRLSPDMLLRATDEQCRGLLEFLFLHGDEIYLRFRERGHWLTIGDLELKELGDRLLRRLYENNSQAALDQLSMAFKSETSFNWSLGYLRHLLWQNGLAGNRPAYPQDQVLSNDELKALCVTASDWLEDPDNRDIIHTSADLASLLFAWRDISSSEAVAFWFTSVTRDDEAYLKLLLKLRTEGIRSDTGRYRALRLGSLTEFIGEKYDVMRRLDAIAANGFHPELISKVNGAIENDRF